MISFLLGTIRNEKHLQALRDITFNLNNKFKCELRTLEEWPVKGHAVLEVSQFPEDNPENFTFNLNNKFKCELRTLEEWPVKGHAVLEVSQFPEDNPDEFYQYASEMIIYQFSRYIGVMYSEKDD